MKIIKFEKIDSTQIFAKSLKTPEAWLVVLAKEQTEGKGRKGDFWYSPKGGLYFSVILPKSNVDDLQTLTILAAFIIGKYIKEKFNLEPFIKLPNDVYLNGKKVAGVITENVIEAKEVKFSVMGIGINTNITHFPKDLENIATSLKIEIGKEVENEKILNQIIEGLKEQLKTISE
jgi:BirA family biotin operon repressor/biotin-[acetyl-CoA-carboxylase] ligase